MKCFFLHFEFKCLLYLLIYDCHSILYFSLIQDVKKYPRIVDDKSKVVFNPYEVDDTTKLSHETTEKSCYSTTLNINEVPDVMVKVHLPARSLLIMYGNAR